MEDALEEGWDVERGGEEDESRTRRALVGGLDDVEEVRGEVVGGRRGWIEEAGLNELGCDAEERRRV
jgi:hypothetical protein